MTKIFDLEDLDCANCANKMENEIKKIDGVNSASVSFISQKMVIDADESKFNAIMKKVVKICKRVEPDCVVKL